MITKKIVPFLSCVLFASILVGCGSFNKFKEDSANINVNTELTAYGLGTPEYIDLYEKKNNIKTVRFKKHDKVLQEIEKFKKDTSALKDPILVSLNGKIFGSDYYQRTNDSERESCYYYGKLKDNKPNGFGILYDSYGNELSGEKENVVIIYAGNFKKGVKEGYGQEYGVTDTEKLEGEIADFLANSGSDEKSFMADSSTTNNKKVQSINYLKSEGEHNKNKLEGLVNVFDYPVLNLKHHTINGEQIGSSQQGIEIYTGNFKNNKLDGNCRIYEDGHLYYEGKCKKDKFEGKGITYFSNGKIKYKGKFHKGKYDGKGTLYEENGKEKYSGKWDNGDCAS